MLRFLDVLGLPIAFQDATTAEFTTSGGDEVQVVGPDELACRLTRSRIGPNVGARR